MAMVHDLGRLFSYANDRRRGLTLRLSFRIGARAVRPSAKRSEFVARRQRTLLLVWV